MAVGAESGDMIYFRFSHTVLSLALLKATGKHGNRLGAGGTSADATAGFYGEKDDQDVQEARYTRGLPHVVPLRP